MEAWRCPIGWGGGGTAAAPADAVEGRQVKQRGASPAHRRCLASTTQDALTPKRAASRAPHRVVQRAIAQVLPQRPAPSRWCALRPQRGSPAGVAPC